MILSEYRDKVRVTRGRGWNSYIVTIQYRGKVYQCHSNNSLAWDRLIDAPYMAERDNSTSGISEKEAFQELYNECKRKNNLR